MSDTEEPKTEKSLQDTKPKLSAKFWRIIINVILLLSCVRLSIIS